MANNPYQKYKSTQVETADNGKLLLMLYDGAIKFSKMAKQAIEEDDYEETNNKLNRVQAIVTELQSTLDMKRGGEIAENLEMLYDYMKRRLITANVDKTVEPVEEVLDMLQELRETWVEAIKKIKTNKSKPQQGINIEG
jgi:flagellar protein FliS